MKRIAGKKQIITIVLVCLLLITNIRLPGLDFSSHATVDETANSDSVQSDNEQPAEFHEPNNVSLTISAPTEMPIHEEPETTVTTETSTGDSEETATAMVPPEEEPEKSAADEIQTAEETEVPVISDEEISEEPMEDVDVLSPEEAFAERIRGDGYAYACVISGTHIFSDDNMRQNSEIGVILEKAVVYVYGYYVKNDHGIVQVQLDTAESVVRGYIDYSCIQGDALELSAIQEIAQAKKDEISTWVDASRGLPLFKTNFALTKDSVEAVIESVHEASMLEETVEPETETEELDSKPDMDATGGYADTETGEGTEEEIGEETKDTENAKQGETAIVPMMLTFANSSPLDEIPDYLTIRIEWEDGDASMHPNNVSVVVCPEGEAELTYNVRASENWELLTSCLLWNREGEYRPVSLSRIASAIWPQYAFKHASLENGVLAITLSEQKKMNLSATIQWDDFDDAANLRPQTIDPSNVRIRYPGSDIDISASSSTKNADGSFSVLFENVPTTYVNSNGIQTKCNGENYSITQLDLPSAYTSSLTKSQIVQDQVSQYKYNVTNKVSMQTVTLDYTMVTYVGKRTGTSTAWNTTEAWQNTEKLGVVLPDTISATLMNGDNPVDIENSTVVFLRNSDGTYPNMKVTWRLPLIDESGQAIVYDNLWVNYSSPENGELSKNFSKSVISSGSNENKTYNVRMSVPSISQYSVKVVWDDNNNQLGLRPKSPQYRLMCDGSPAYYQDVYVIYSTYNLLQLNEEGAYKHYTADIVDLSNCYTYGRTESPVFLDATGYGAGRKVDAVSVTETLKLHLDGQSATAHVKWQGDGIGTGDELLNRPQQYPLELYYSADDGVTWDLFWGNSLYMVNPGTDMSDWVYEWKGLPETDESGHPVIYKVEPTGVPGFYTTNVATPVSTTDADGKKHWDFEISNSYNDNWNYSLDLYWNTTDPLKKYDQSRVETLASSGSASYVLSISVQKAYDIGDLSVRIPWELFDSRLGKDKGTVPSLISLGDENNPSPAYSFTYRIDDKGTADTSDDEIVFYNYKPLSASDNCMITVTYPIEDWSVIDCTTGVLQATGSGNYKGQTSGPEVIQTREISYRIDNGVRLLSASKKHLQNLYSWDSNYGPQPVDFDPEHYNYVLWQIEADVDGIQPHQLTFIDIPGEGGEVVGYINESQKGVSGSGASKNWIKPKNEANPGEPFWEKTDDGYKWTVTGKWRSNSTYSAVYPFGVFKVIVKYPRVLTPVPGEEGVYTAETDYHNTVRLKLEGTDVHEGDKEADDLNDVFEATRTAEGHWKDYVYTYTGSLTASSKELNSFPSGSATILKYGDDVSARFYAYAYGYGYELGEEGYTLELVDDTVTAYARIDSTNTRPYRLTEDDYELTGTPYVDVKCFSIDRTNGASLPGIVPTGTFTLYGRKGINGPWEKLDSFVMTSTSYTYTSTKDITGQGYTGLKVVSPSGLRDRFSMNLGGCFVTLHANSELLSDWANREGINSITVSNKDSANLYDVDGSLLGSTSAIADSTLSTVSVTRDYGKKLDSISYDPVTEMIQAQFTLYGNEQLNTSQLPQTVLDGYCHDKGIFYDLLPLGFVIDEKQPITVYASITAYYVGNTGELIDLTIIDNYRESGRQMLVFTVTSSKDPGRNWSNGGTMTGFGIRFYAKASYDDVPSETKGYNIAAYQRLDGKAMTGGCTECGYSYSGEEFNQLGSDGNRLLYDLNGDGVVDENLNNTYYMSVRVNPSYPRTIENGLRKLVKASSGTYKTSDIVDLDGDYSYKLSLMTSSSGETRNVVVYDILENAANTGSASGEGDGWKGTLQGVNVNAARQLGIDVKVFYCTDTEISYNATNSEGNWQYLLDVNPGAWSETPPADLSTVTALAFDLRKATNLNDFVFTDGLSAYVEIRMKAPSELQPWPYAYNRPAYDCELRARGAEEWGGSFNIASRTALMLEDLQDVSFVKQYENDSAIYPMPNVTFELYRCSNTETNHQHNGMPGTSGSCWDKLIGTQKSRSNGQVNFTDLPTGNYAIVEKGPIAGFTVPTDCYWTFAVDGIRSTVRYGGMVSVGTGTAPEMIWEAGENTAEGHYTLTNERPIRKLGVRKTWNEDAERILLPEKLTFDLIRNGEIVDTREIDAKDVIGGVLTDLFTGYVYSLDGKLYSYEIRERAPEGYLSSGGSSYTPWSDGSYYYYITNTRLGVLEIEKQVVNTDTEKSFGFCVELKRGNGTPYTGTFTMRRYTAESTVFTSESVATDAEGKLHLSIASGEKVQLIGIPVSSYSRDNINYAVSEDMSDYTVTYTGNLTGALGSKITPRIVFTNTPKATELSLPVSKAIEGDVPENQKDSFTFELTAVTQGAPMPDPATATVEGEGSTAFAAIPFVSTGEYVYKVKEIAENEQYSFDTTEYEVTVTVTDQNGQMNAEWTASKDGEKADELKFVNTYLPPDAELVIPVQKRIEGNDRPIGEEETFEFVLTAITPDAPMPEDAAITITDEGRVEFGAIAFADEGEFEYQLCETVGNTIGYGYDIEPRTLKVIVEKKDGLLDARWTVDDKEADVVEFVNTYYIPRNFTVLKTDQTNRSLRLSGAKFSLYRDEACAELVSAYADADYTVQADEFTTDDDGGVTLYGLMPGVYFLKETFAPTGYYVIDTALKVMISETGKVTTDETQGKHIEVDDSAMTAIVKDIPYLVLPSTGGIGTKLFVITGIFLMGIGAFLLYKRKKR